MIAWFSIAISIIAVCASWYAVYINEENLRLKLYEMRFEIYSKTIDMYDEAGHFDASNLNASFDTFDIKYRAFKKAYMESKLLFDANDEIYEMLRDMEGRCYRIIGFKKALNVQQNSQAEDALIQDLAEALNWMDNNMHKLLDLMAPYLNFHDISPWRRIKQRVCLWFAPAKNK